MRLDSVCRKPRESHRDQQKPKCQLHKVLEDVPGLVLRTDKISCGPNQRVAFRMHELVACFWVGPKKGLRVQD